MNYKFKLLHIFVTSIINNINKNNINNKIYNSRRFQKENLIQQKNLYFKIYHTSDIHNSLEK